MPHIFRRHRERGFTHVELLVLLAVIALPVTMVLTGYRHEFVRTLLGEVGWEQEAADPGEFRVLRTKVGGGRDGWTWDGGPGAPYRIDPGPGSPPPQPEPETGRFTIVHDEGIPSPLTAGEPVTIGGTVLLDGAPVPNLSFGAEDDLAGKSRSLATDGSGRFSYSTTPSAPGRSEVRYLIGSEKITKEFEVGEAKEPTDWMARAKLFAPIVTYHPGVEYLPEPCPGDAVPLSGEACCFVNVLPPERGLEVYQYWFYYPKDVRVHEEAEDLAFRGAHRSMIDVRKEAEEKGVLQAIWILSPWTYVTDKAMDWVDRKVMEFFHLHDWEFVAVEARRGASMPETIVYGAHAKLLRVAAAEAPMVGSQCRVTVMSDMHASFPGGEWHPDQPPLWVRKLKYVPVRNPDIPKDEWWFRLKALMLDWTAAGLSGVYQKNWPYVDYSECLRDFPGPVLEHRHDLGPDDYWPHDMPWCDWNYADSEHKKSRPRCGWNKKKESHEP